MKGTKRWSRLGFAASMGLFGASALASGDGVGLGFAGMSDPASDRPAFVLGGDEAEVPEGVLRLIERHVWLALPEVHKNMVRNAVARAAAGIQDHARAIACCAEGTPDEIIEAVNRVFDRGGYQDRYRRGPRWANTALQGPTGPEGNPVTLTYSFCPDGTPIDDAPNPDLSSNLFAYLNGIYGSPAAWQAVYAQVFARWGELSGLTFVYEPNDDGTKLPDNDGVAGVRGDMRMAGTFIDGPSGVLAYNYYPQAGDMVIDTGDTFFNDTSGNSLRLRNVLAHEMGHGLGQPHTCPIYNNKLMEPFISVAYDGPRHDDIRQAQRYYGDATEPNNSAATSINAGAVAVGATVTLGGVPAPAVTLGSLLSIDTTSDVDFIRFTTASAQNLSVTLTPLGQLYDDSAQACNGQSASCCFGNFTDSAVVADLGIELLASDGTTVLASSLSGSAGVVERVVDYRLPAAGTYYVRVVATGGGDQSQLYSLALSGSNPTLSLTVPNPPILLTPGSPSNFDVLISAGSQSLAAGGRTLFYRQGTSGAFSSTSLTSLGGNLYRATLPAFNCGGSVQFYVQAQGSGGATVTSPVGAPASVYTAIVGSLSTVFADDFEANLPWTTSAAGATAGLWERVDPEASAAQPGDDHTASGVTCYVTGQHVAGAGVGTSDVDGGSVTLTSPTFSLDGSSDAHISFWRWYSNAGGSSPNLDVFTVEISSNNGGAWTTVQTIGPASDNTGGWLQSSFRLSSVPAVARTNQMRIRFTAADLNPGSVIEAAVDDVLIQAITCTSPSCVADVDDGSGTGTPDGGVTIDDLLYYLAIFEAGSVDADVDDGSSTGTPDGGVTIDDLLYYLVRFESGC
jgi:hypothetical protein